MTFFFLIDIGCTNVSLISYQKHFDVDRNQCIMKKIGWWGLLGSRAKRWKNMSCFAELFKVEAKI